MRQKEIEERKIKDQAWSTIREIVLCALWFPALVFIAHLVLYFIFDVYRRVQHLDLLTHSVGGIAIAYMFSMIFAILARREVMTSMGGVVTSVLIFALTATVAVFWEFGEYIFDKCFSTHVQVDLEDTLSDMAFGILGGLIFLLLRPARRPYSS